MKWKQQICSHKGELGKVDPVNWDYCNLDVEVFVSILWKSTNLQIDRYIDLSTTLEDTCILKYLQSLIHCIISIHCFMNIKKVICTLNHARVRKDWMKINLYQIILKPSTLTRVSLTCKTSMLIIWSSSSARTSSSCLQGWNFNIILRQY